MSSVIFQFCRRLYQLALFYFMLLWLAGMLLIGNASSIILYLLPVSLRELIEQRLISATFHLFLQGAQGSGLMHLDLSDLDELNQESALILAANHPSMIDVFLVISRVHKVSCLMKASLASNLLLGIGANLAGYISNNDTSEMLKQAAQAVLQGNKLLIFPEGTRTILQPINDLKAGIFLIAKLSKAPIQTILLTTNSAYLSKGWPIWRPPTFPLVYKAQLGERFSYEDLQGQGATRLQNFFTSSISRSIDPNLTF